MGPGYRYFPVTFVQVVNLVRVWVTIKISVSSILVLTLVTSTTSYGLFALFKFYSVDLITSVMVFYGTWRNAIECYHSRPSSFSNEVSNEKGGCLTHR